jgi:hypothetical protein
LDATTFTVIALDGRELLISMDQVITPKTIRLVTNEGMPLLNTN